jgi:hypothetical protein
MIPEGKALGLMVMVLILLLFALLVYLIALPTILEGKGIDIKKLKKDVNKIKERR